MDIKNIMVIGSGLMGSGIAQVSSQAGYNVIMNDVTTEFIDKGFNSISKGLDGQVKREKITTADKDAILSRISKAPSLEDAKKADLIIEAAFENFEVKKAISRSWILFAIRM
jgi:3-hydroxybutyryl-CoA dehydrogenase